MRLERHREPLTSSWDGADERPSNPCRIRRVAGVAPVAGAHEFGRTARFRIEALIVGCLWPSSGCCRCRVRAAGAALGRFVHAVDGFHRRIAMANLRRRCRRSRSRSARRCAACSRTSAAAARADQVRHAVERRESWRASDRGRGARPAGLRKDAACCSSPAISATGRCGHRARPARAADGGAGAAARQSAPARHARTHPHAHRQLGDLSAGRDPQGAARAGRKSGVAILIDQHLHTPDAVYVDFFSRPGGDDVGAGGAGAAHRRAGDPGVRAAASRTDAIGSSTSTRWSRRPTDSPDAVREFTQRCTDVLEMHSPPSGAVALDASPWRREPARRDANDAARAWILGAELARRCA